MADIIDSYAESNYSGVSYGISGYSSHWKAIGQSFVLTEGKKITSCRFYLSRLGTLSGVCYAKIYAHTGTWGVNGKATGSSLGTSNPVVASSIAEGFNLVRFNFSGAEQFTPSDKVPYVLAFEYTVNNGNSNRIQAGVDTTTPSHVGNLCYKETNWAVVFPVVADTIFYLYAGDVAITNRAKNPFKIFFMKGA